MRSIFNIRPLIQAAFAEFVGTYIFVVIGNGSVAQSHLAKGRRGDYFTINWGWALAYSFGILISLKVSGGHLNPAVTMALAISRDFPWKRLPLYWIAQYLGALAASGTVLGIYYAEAMTKTSVRSEQRMYRNITTSNSTELNLGSIFINYPLHKSNIGVALAEETLSTMVLMLVICAVTNSRYMKVPEFLQPFCIGFTLLAVGVSYGSTGGYSLNPARDMAPRFVSFIGGWGPGVFSFRDYKGFWIFIVGPHVGAILGVFISHMLLKGVPAEPSEEKPTLDTEPVIEPEHPARHPAAHRFRKSFLHDPRFFEEDPYRTNPHLVTL